MKPSLPPDSAAHHAEFSALYEGCAGWLYGYLLSLLHRPQDADEVLQQTAEVLWRKFDQYDRGTEFRAWACRVAHFKALKHREKSQRRPTAFSDLFVDSVDEEAVVMADRLDTQAAALQKCLEKLPSRDRQIVAERYTRGGTVESIAKSMTCSTHSIYRALTRIHSALHRCVSRVLADEGAR